MKNMESGRASERDAGGQELCSLGWAHILDVRVVAYTCAAMPAASAVIRLSGALLLVQGYGWHAES